MKKLIATLALSGCTTTPLICPHDLPVDKYGRAVEVCRAGMPDWSRPVILDREDRDDRGPRVPESDPKPEPKPEKPGKPDPCACGPGFQQKGAA